MINITSYINNYYIVGGWFISLTWTLSANPDVMLSTTCLLRKRRRQNWHLKQKLKNPTRRITKDGGKWEAEPAPARRQVFIEEKLKVVRFWNQLKEEKEKAMAVVRRPMRGLQGTDRDELIKQKAAAKQVLKQNLLNECRKKFPTIVQQAQVFKWAQQAAKEHWESIPKSDRVRWTEVSGLWREKMGLAKKGRSFGGYVPLPIQAELDRLICEHAMGSSDISERKDVISAQQIESWIWKPWPGLS